MTKRSINFAFDLLFFRRLGRILKYLIVSPINISIIFLLLTLASSIASKCSMNYVVNNNCSDEVVTYYFGLIPSKMYLTLGSRNESQFWHTFVDGTLICIGKISVYD
jgi:hypothetical protein